LIRLLTLAEYAMFIGSFVGLGVYAWWNAG